MIHKVCGDRLSKNAMQAIKTYIKEFEEGVLQKLKASGRHDRIKADIAELNQGKSPKGNRLFMLKYRSKELDAPVRADFLGMSIVVSAGLTHAQLKQAIHLSFVKWQKVIDEEVTKMQIY